MSDDARQVRGPRLVDMILDATLEELAAKGYDALSFEEVAARVGVAKTTLYRRWPTKDALVRAVLGRTTDAVVFRSDTGTVRGDLFETLTRLRAFLTSAPGRSLLRMTVGSGVGSDLLRLADGIREEKEAFAADMVARAVARGELPEGTRPRLVVETLVGSLMHSVLFVHDAHSDEALRDLIELVLVGAANGGATNARKRKAPPKPPKSPKPPPKKR